MQKILSIQSHVSYGYVGNKVATFVLQRMGFDVIPIFTVQFSNHTGYGVWGGDINKAQHITDILTGLNKIGVLPEVSAVISGYLGNAEIGKKVLEAINIIQPHNPALMYCCDPVMGNEDGCFVKPGISEFFQHKAVPAANIITPNLYELSFLADQAINSIEDAVTAANTVRALGPSMIIATGLLDTKRNSKSIYMLLSTDEGSWLIEQPKLETLTAASGAGDLTTAMFIGQYLSSKDPVSAFEHTAGTLTDIITLTRKQNSKELEIIRGQEAIVKPNSQFKATPIDSDHPGTHGN